MAKNLQFKWQLQPKFLLLVCAVLPITITAGFWQLDRAEQKRLILDEQRIARSVPSRELETVSFSELKNYLKASIEGEWAEAQFLLDNRMRSGRVGYEVIRILERENNLPILVNLGWVEASSNRNELPDVQSVSGKHRIEGYLYRASQEALVLAEQQWQQSWPERLQAIDFQLIEERVNQELYPYVLRISVESPLAYRADWSIEQSDPQMHLGYAVQWFLMSFTLVLMTLFASSNLGAWLKSAKQPNEFE